MTVDFNLYECGAFGVKHNQCDVVGDDIDEIVEAMILRVRPQSKEFYRKELRRDLERNGESLVDVHAGGGIHYRVCLTGHADQLMTA